jgi:hypothetical protein
MSNLVKNIVQLAQEARASGAGEFNHLMEYFNDLENSDEKNVQVYIASCDEFIAYAKHIKETLGG